MNTPEINLDNIIGLKLLEVYAVPFIPDANNLGGVFHSNISLLFEKQNEYLIIGANHEIEEDLESNVELNIKWSDHFANTYTSYGRKVKNHKYLYRELGRVVSYSYNDITPYTNSSVKSILIKFQMEEGSIVIFGDGPMLTLNLKLQT